MFLLLVAFIAGALTALAPCTVSLLPVIVGGSISGGTSTRRALVVTASLGISVILFTLALKVSTALIHVPQEFWQYLSGVIIVFLGLAMIFPSLWDMIPGLGAINRGSNRLMATGYQKQNVIGDVLVGAALGPVFSSCSPTYFLILATVLPRSLTAGIVYLLAYALGLCVLLLVITIAGQKLLEKIGVASDPRGRLKRGIGVLFLVVGVAIFFGYDKKLELAITNAGYFDESKIEQLLLGGNTASMLAPATDSAAASDGPVSADSRARIAMKQLKYPLAPEITNPSGYVNTDGMPITIGEFRGKKVVLVDFWTYSCINCQRTLPYMRAWYEKYHDKGLEIIAIHTPEFAFEKVKGNVEKAVAGFQLKYPSVLDNDYGTWNAFGNNYWPRKYLVDIDGYIVYDHAGEGSYDETEKAIKKALAERESVLGMPSSIDTNIVEPAGVVSVDASGLGSPETYFGSARNEYLGNGKKHTNGMQTFTLPANPYFNALYLGGVWNFTDEYAQAQGSAKIVYRYKAKDVYFVASSAQGTKITLLLDGAPIGTAGGEDVAPDGSVNIKDNRLYHLVHTTEYGEHTLEIQIDATGIDAYTFTFG